MTKTDNREKWEEEFDRKFDKGLRDLIGVDKWEVKSFIRTEIAKAKKNGEILAYGKLRQLFAEMPLRGYTSEELAECFDKIAPLDPKGLLKKIPKLGLTEKGEVRIDARRKKN